ncbi:MAG: M20 family metallopeptidase, partial [Promethearchaeota archaeon]
MKKIRELVMNEEQILTFIDKNKENYIKFLQTLIKAESYNPPGNEMNVAVKIKEYLEQVDLKCDIFPFGDNRSNLIAYLNNEYSGKVLLYNGHMDVVPPGNEAEWRYPPLSAFRIKDEIFGRGTSDMKGPLAAMVVSLKILKKLGGSFPGNLILNAVADEETGGTKGTKWCLENIFEKNKIKCNFAIIGEPSRLPPLPSAVIVGEKGRLVLKIITY